MKVNIAEVTDEILSNIKNIVNHGEDMEFFCYNLTPNNKKTFLKVLEIFLGECNQVFMYNSLSYCVLELLDNASKANAKRIYFQDRKLNIKDQADYADGMQNFKDAISNNTKYYNEMMENNILQINLKLSSDGIICIKVTNNSQIALPEIQRIKDRIKKTENYNSLADALSDLDQTEGAGWGIISIVLMLRKFGLGPEHLKIETTDTDTSVSLIIPVIEDAEEIPDSYGNSGLEEV